MERTGGLNITIKDRKTKKGIKDLTVEIIEGGKQEDSKVTDEFGVAKFVDLIATEKNGKTIIIRKGEKIFSEAGNGFDILANNTIERDFFIDNL